MRYLILLSALLLFNSLFSQGTEYKDSPKLIVGVVVDQMRYDYLSRFWDRFGEDGFKRLVKEGFNFKNNHINYLPTSTGPGHASIFTGTSPMNHGIIGNSWFDKKLGEMVYCAGDDSVTPVGTSSPAGKMSPHRMKPTTFADENRIHTQFRGKTIGVSIKDRGAILPAGHTANAAYWFHGEDEGKFISSSYYFKEMPEWAKKFNNSGRVEGYFRSWAPLNSLESYKESGGDENLFEGGFKGKKTATFPYDLKKLRKFNGNFDVLVQTPFGNDLTLEFAIEAIKGEQLGQDEHTDVLTLSFSGTDKIGHNFGVNSMEMEDAFIRLDLNIADLLNFLDNHVGKGEYTLFLTADHGGIHVPAYLESIKAPGGYFNMASFRTALFAFAEKTFEVENLIQNISNYQVFLDYDLIESTGFEREQVEKKLGLFILTYNKVDQVFTRTQLLGSTYEHGLGQPAQLGFNQKRSGDLLFILDPGNVAYKATGSTHGSGLSYDTHVPLIFYGKQIPTGNTNSRSQITDIAPTVSSILGISFPSLATGSPLRVMLDTKNKE
jgi:predicted AlkP superfamily pyrophosphatase or phosphodiesterase